MEVAHLSIEGRRHLSLCKGHGEISEEGHAEDAEVGRETLGMNDGAWADIDECAAFEVAVLQVEVDISFTTHEDTQAVIVDSERWPLVHQQTERRVVAANHSQFAIKKDMLSDLREVWCENVAHPSDVHQLRLSVHNKPFLLAKIRISERKTKFLI